MAPETYTLDLHRVMTSISVWTHPPKDWSSPFPFSQQATKALSTRADAPSKCASSLPGAQLQKRLRGSHPRRSKVLYYCFLFSIDPASTHQIPPLFLQIVCQRVRLLGQTSCQLPGTQKCETRSKVRYCCLQNRSEVRYYCSFLSYP